MDQFNHLSPYGDNEINEETAPPAETKPDVDNINKITLLLLIQSGLCAIWEHTNKHINIPHSRFYLHWTIAEAGRPFANFTHQLKEKKFKNWNLQNIWCAAANVVLPTWAAAIGCFESVEVIKWCNCKRHWRWCMRKESLCLTCWESESEVTESKRNWPSKFVQAKQGIFIQFLRMLIWD